MLRPFYGLYARRHSVYLRVEPEAALDARDAREQQAAAEQRAVDARTVDGVAVGAVADETAHELVAERAGAWSLEGRSCRSTRYGGSWSYSLRLPPGGPAALRVTYWGGETRRHQFEVTAEGETLATQSLFDDRPGELYAVEYPLPERLTAGASACASASAPVRRSRRARSSTCAWSRLARLLEQALDRRTSLGRRSRGKTWSAARAPWPTIRRGPAAPGPHVPARPGGSPPPRIESEPGGKPRAVGRVMSLSEIGSAPRASLRIK